MISEGALTRVTIAGLEADVAARLRLRASHPGRTLDDEAYHGRRLSDRGKHRIATGRTATRNVQDFVGRGIIVTNAWSALPS